MSVWYLLILKIIVKVALKLVCIYKNLVDKNNVGNTVLLLKSLARRCDFCG